jgi:hypothetical protein
LSTLEAAALLLRFLDNRPDIEAALVAALDRLIAETRRTGGRHAGASGP